MIFHNLCVAAVTVALMLAMTSSVQAVQHTETMLEVGKWKVFRVVATEKESAPSCFAIYEREPEVQMWPVGIFIKFSEPIEQVNIAFGDESFRGLRLTSPMERKFNLIRFADQEFKDLLESDQMQIRVLTEGKQKLSRTLKTTGAKEVHAYLLAGCPGDPLAPLPKGCESGLEQTLRSQGTPENQIAELCGKPAV